MSHEEVLDLAVKVNFSLLVSLLTYIHNYQVAFLLEIEVIKE